MPVTPTHNGGRQIADDTRLLAYTIQIEPTAHGRHLRLIDSDGNEHGHAHATFRQIPPDVQAAIAQANGAHFRGGGCNDCAD